MEPSHRSVYAMLLFTGVLACSNEVSPPGDTGTGTGTGAGTSGESSTASNDGGADSSGSGDSAGSDTGDVAPIHVVEVSPVPQRIDAPRDSDLVVTFDGAVDPSSIDSQSLRVFGRWSGVSTGSSTFEAGDTALRFNPDRDFMLGEWVTVTLSTAVRSAGGLPLEQGYAWGFWAASGPGSLSLVEIDQRSLRQGGEGWIQSYGAYAGDLDGDGFSDLMIPNERANDVRVLLNDGAGAFPEFVVYPIPDGAVPSTNEGADFNADGTIDFAVGNAGGDLVSTFMGAGDGTFMHHQNYTVGESVRGLCVLDLDGTGSPDIVVSSRVGDDSMGNVSVLINDGTGAFEQPISEDVGLDGETSCAAADANNDGIVDVFVGGLFSNDVILLVGDGKGGLDISDSVVAGGGPWMLAAGDVNGDGNVDVVGSDQPRDAVSVIFGDGAGGLGDAEVYPADDQPLAIDLGDLDGDGDLDMVASNFQGGNWTLFENAGDGTFDNQSTLPASTAGSCAILHDRDNDGDLDMTAIDELDDILFLFDNPGE